ncbi:MAG: hypothetical protein WAO24_04135 [Peptococcia bacterium]
MSVFRKLFYMGLILALLAAGCNKPIENNYVLATSKNPKEGGSWTELAHSSLDLDLDGQEDVIALYTAAERDNNGELMWDDGQNWLLLIKSGENYYPLLNEYVQLGSVYFSAFTDLEEQPKVFVLINTGAGIIAKEYAYEAEKQGFREKLVYQAEGINLLGSSFPAY